MNVLTTAHLTRRIGSLTLLCKAHVPKGAMSTNKESRGRPPLADAQTEKCDPTKETETWNPRNEFDIIAVASDGGAVWVDYGDPCHFIVTKKGESPSEVVARREREEKRKGTIERAGRSEFLIDRGKIGCFHKPVHANVCETARG